MDGQTDSVLDVAEKETARQTVILLFTLASTVGTIWVIRKFSGPDSFELSKKRAALFIKHYAQRRVDWWQRIADKAATIYHE